MSPQELAASKGDEWQLLTYWCAKEALYKYYSKGNVEFSQNLYLHPFQLKTKGILLGKIMMPDLGTEFPLGYEIINIGGGNLPLSVNSMIAQLENHLRKKAEINYKPAFSADMVDTAASIEKAKNLLNWEPLTPPEDGLRLTAEWHLRENKWLKSIKL